LEIPENAFNGIEEQNNKGKYFKHTKVLFKEDFIQYRLNQIGCGRSGGSYN
jgi:hypothetical protein